MAEPEELLSKADALMERHRKPRSPADPPADIPVLTEVVEVHAAVNSGPAIEAPDDDAGNSGLPTLTELPPAWQATPAPQPAFPHVVPAQDQAPEDETPESLAAGIRAALLVGLQPEIDRQIEDRLKYMLEPLVERMFNDLRDDLQTISREVLAAAIRTAVERELDKQKSRG